MAILCLRNTKPIKASFQICVASSCPWEGRREERILLNVVDRCTGWPSLSPIQLKQIADHFVIPDFCSERRKADDCLCRLMGVGVGGG